MVKKTWFIKNMRCFCLQFAISLVLVFVAGVLQAAEPALHALSINDEHRRLWPEEMVWVEDVAGSLTLDELLQRNNPAFLSGSGSGQPALAGKAAWIRVNVRRELDAPKEWLLSLGATVFDDVHFYSQAADGHWKELPAGIDLPFAGVLLPGQSPLFPLMLRDANPHSFFVRIAPSPSQPLDVQAWQPLVLQRSVAVNLLITGGMAGLLALLCVASLAHGFLAGDRHPAILSVLSLLVFLTAVAWSGVLGSVLPSVSMAAFRRAAEGMLYLIYAANLLAFRHILSVDRYFPPLAGLWRPFAGIALIGALAVWGGMYPLGSPWLHLLFVFSFGLNIVAASRAVQARRPRAGLWLCACLVHGASVVMLLAWLQGWMAMSFTLAQVFGDLLIAFLVLFNLGLRDRLIPDNALPAGRQPTVVDEQQLRNEQAVYFSLIAHELRTPLAVIRTGLANLKRNLADALPEIKARVKRINNAADSMSELINKHLTMERLAAGQMVAEFACVLPAQPMMRAVEWLRELYPERLVDCRETGALSVPVQMDADLVKHALMNLLENAAKYSPPRMPIFIAAEVVDGYLVYRVRDQGNGINGRNSADTVRTFRRQHAGGEGPLPGFGLGLAMVERIAQLHEGNMDYMPVIKDGRDTGTEFIFRIPYQHNEPSASDLAGSEPGLSK